MDWLHAVFLALVQGFTEFLPISSSAHLILPAQLFGWPDQGLAFDVAVHVGTLFAIILYFRSELVVLFQAWCRSLATRKSCDDSRLAWLIILATIPAGLAGFIFNDFISMHLRSTEVIAGTTILFGIVLFLSDRLGSRSLSLSAMTIGASLIIGLSQTLALIPGTSRSGITMTAALFLGYSRDAAARFSFLLSIPLIAAAGLLKGKELVDAGGATDWSAMAIGTFVAFASAYACIHMFLSFLEKIGFTPFVIYRLLLGMVLVILIFVSA